MPFIVSHPGLGVLVAFATSTDITDVLPTLSS